MTAEALGYGRVAAEFTDACDADDRVEDYCIEHTGGGCHSVGVTLTDAPFGLFILVGDADGPLSWDSAPERWGASVSFSNHGEFDIFDEGYEEYTELAEVGPGTPAEILDALVAIAERCQTREGREALEAETEAAWMRSHAAYMVANTACTGRIDPETGFLVHDTECEFHVTEDA